jgi:hypothetical protein
MNYNTTLTQKLQEQAALQRQLETVNQEIILLTQLSNLGNNTTETAKPITFENIVKFYSEIDLKRLSSKEIYTILAENVCKVVYIKADKSERVFKKASMCDDYTYEAFKKIAPSQHHSKYDERYIHIVERKSGEYNLKKLITDNLVSITII